MLYAAIFDNVHEFMFRMESSFIADGILVVAIIVATVCGVGVWCYCCSHFILNFFSSLAAYWIVNLLK